MFQSLIYMHMYRTTDVYVHIYRRMFVIIHVCVWRRPIYTYCLLYIYNFVYGSLWILDRRSLHLGAFRIHPPKLDWSREFTESVAYLSWMRAIIYLAQIQLGVRQLQQQQQQRIRLRSIKFSWRHSVNGAIPWVMEQFPNKASQNVLGSASKDNWENRSVREPGNGPPALKFMRIRWTAAVHRLVVSCPLCKLR